MLSGRLPHLKSALPVLVAVAVVGLFGLGMDTARAEASADREAVSSPSAGGRTVVLVSYRPARALAPLLSFIAETTDLDVQVREVSPAALVERLQSEDRPLVGDVVLTVDSLRLGELAAAGLLGPMPEAFTAELAPGLRDPAGRWAPVSWRWRAPVRLVDGVETIVRDYGDLSDPALAGRLCIRDPRHVYGVGLTAWYLARHGRVEAQRWQRGWTGNLAGVAGGDIAQIRALADGDCDVALTNHYYISRLRQSGDPELRQLGERVMFGFDELRSEDTGDAEPPAVYINISGVARLADAPNPEAAEALLEALLSRAGIDAYAERFHEFPAYVDPAGTLELPAGHALETLAPSRPAGRPFPAQLLHYVPEALHLIAQ